MHFFAKKFIFASLNRNKYRKVVGTDKRRLTLLTSNIYENTAVLQGSVHPPGTSIFLLTHVMNKKLNDKIKGALYGCAYGDTLGFGTEMMTKSEARRHYPKGLRSFSHIITDAHRLLWPHGHWTNDTERFLSVIDSATRCNRIDLQDVAKSLKDALLKNPLDVVPYARKLLENPEWLDKPLEVSRRSWDLGDQVSTNEGIFSSVVAAFTSDDEHFEQDAMDLSGMLLHSNICKVTGLMASMMARKLLFEDRPADYEELAEVAHARESRILPYLELAHDGELSDLDLDNEDTCTYTRKCLCSALWTVWHCDNAEDMIHLLVDEGGDSDSNASLAGLYAGLIYGYDAIPAEKENMLERERLDTLAQRLTEYVEAKFDL